MERKVTKENIKMSDKLEHQFIDLMKLIAVNRLIDKQNPNYIPMSDRFDFEKEDTDKIIRSTVMASFSILSEFLKLSSRDKAKIEKLHEQAVRKIYEVEKDKFSDKEREIYVRGMQKTFGYDFSKL